MKTSSERLTDELSTIAALVSKGAVPDVFALIAELDLSISQLRALHVLEARDRSLALHELAEAMELSVAATSRAVDVLARGGLVSRDEDPADRRVKRIAIADAGREIVARIVAARRDGLRRVVETLDDAERGRLSEALRPILERPELRALCARERP